jgi:hypothetical protein
LQVTEITGLRAVAALKVIVCWRRSRCLVKDFCCDVHVSGPEGTLLFRERGQKRIGTIDGCRGDSRVAATEALSE